MANSKPWDRLDEETPAPWRAFQLFLTLPAPRSLQALQVASKGILGPAEGYGIPTLEDYSAHFLWFDRAQAYDEWLAHKRHMGAAAIATKTGARLARKQMRATNMALEIATKKFQELLGAGPKGHGTFAGSEVNAHQAARLLREAVILGRLITGEATERVEEKTTDLTKLSDAQLAELEKSMKIARGE